MKRLLALLLLAGCATVPRDAGLGELRQEVTARTGQSLDDPRAAQLLQEELSADNAVAIAMANSARLQATLAELGVARAELQQASLPHNPLFEAEVRFPRDPFRPFELRLAQTLIDLVQLPRRRALGRIAFDAAKLRITTEVVRFAGDVRLRHAELLAASQRAALMRTNVEAARAATELAQRQHDVGNITDLELETEQSNYEQAKLDLAREERQLIVAREELVRAMGIRADLRLPAVFPALPESEQNAQQLEQLALARRLDIELARNDVSLTRAGIPVARLAALGEVTADIHYQRDAQGAKTVGPGIELPLPIFNTGSAARSRAEAEYLRATQTLNALTTEASSHVREAAAVVDETRARVAYYRDVVIPRRQRIVELTKLEHNAMLIGPFQLLQAKQNEVQAQRDFIDAQRDYWTARAELELAVNGGR